MLPYMCGTRVKQKLAKTKVGKNKSWQKQKLAKTKVGKNPSWS